MKRSIFALALAAALPLSAQASELSYTYVEGDYVNVDSDADGVAVRGSFNFGASDFYGFGGYGSVNLDNSNIDIDEIELGFGYHYALNDKSHLIAELAYTNDDVGPFSIDGYRTSVGVRTAFTDKVEGLLKANFSDVENNNNKGDFSGTAGLLVKLNNTWGINGEVEFAEHNVQTYTVGIRASF